VRCRDVRRGDRQGDGPARKRDDDTALVGRQVVLHAAVPRGDRHGDQRHVVDDDRPAGPFAVLAEHEPVTLGVRLQPERRTRLGIVVTEQARELRGRQQHGGQHVQCVVVRDIRVHRFRTGHGRLLPACVGAP
jgi:hypothetical protein